MEPLQCPPSLYLRFYVLVNKHGRNELSVAHEPQPWPFTTLPNPLYPPRWESTITIFSWEERRLTAWCSSLGSLLTSHQQMKGSFNPTRGRSRERNGPCLKGEAQPSVQVPLLGLWESSQGSDQEASGSKLLSQCLVPNIEPLGLSDQDWGRQPAREGS